MNDTTHTIISAKPIQTRYEIECINPYVIEAIRVVLNIAADDYEYAKDQLSNIANDYHGQWPMIFRLRDQMNDSILDFVILEDGVQRWRHGQDWGRFS